MQLVNLLKKIFKYDGFILIDSDSKKYVIGKPNKEIPIQIRILDKSLNYKLLLLPDLYFGEAYTNGSLIIENGTLTEFLEIAFRNIGRKDFSLYSKILNKIRGSYRYLTNFNKILNSKNNVSHHYDISEKLYDLFLDEKRQYSCAYFKNEKNTLIRKLSELEHLEDIVIHPIYGKMTKEKTLFLIKHHTMHHLNQFGLLK